MPELTPAFDNEAIAEIVMELYRLEGEISPLVSYEDQNARIKTSEGIFVLKIANKRWPLDGLYMQTEVLERAKKAKAPELMVPQLMPAAAGETVAIVDDFAIRLLSFLEGNILADAPREPALYRGIGHFMGQFTSMMEGYTHPAAHRPDDLWNMDNVAGCKVYLPSVEDGDTRACIERLFGIYENKVLPKVPALRKAVIHNDANDTNLLVDTGDAARIAGLIDFGDIVAGSLVNELAITMAYALLGEDDIEGSAHEMIQGFTREFPLQDVELEVLSCLTAVRLVQSITLTSHRAKEFPDNAYLSRSQKQAGALLKRLDKEPVLTPMLD